MSYQSIIRKLKTLNHPSEEAKEEIELFTLMNELDDRAEQLRDQGEWIDTRKRELNRIAIHKIPFTKYTLFDDIGLFNHRIPGLLEDDAIDVTEYNHELAKLKNDYAILDKKVSIFKKKWGLDNAK